MMDIYKADIQLKELRSVLTTYTELVDIALDGAEDKNELQDKTQGYIDAIDYTTDFLESVIMQIPTGTVQ